MIAICALGWNHAATTRRWLESVQRNSYGHDVQFFLMDNGSTDHGETTQALTSVNPTVFIRNENNDSIHIGWNKLLGLALDAGAEQICLSNNDLLVGPMWLDAVERELKPGVKKYFLPNGDVPLDNFEQEAALTTVKYKGQTRPGAMGGWCLIFHREAIPLFRPIPEELILWYGDNWIHDRLADAGYSCETLLDCCVHHYTSTSFYTRAGYVEIVARDKEIYERLKMERIK